MDLVSIAKLFFGTKYVFGGNTIEEGLDCSGFVCECLRSLGKIGKEDYSAQMLFNHLNKTIASYPTRNAILFFGKDAENVSHVAIAVSERLMIEAGGEGRENTANGYVRIRPIKNRRDFLGAYTI